MPRAAAHPMSGGSAPGTAPTIVERDVTRFNGVYTKAYERSVARATPAASREVAASMNRPSAARPIASATASGTAIRPSATGRWRVRFISRSMSRSEIWFSAAAPPATNAVPRQVLSSSTGSVAPCDPSQNPPAVVATTSVLTRTFVSVSRSVGLKGADGTASVSDFTAGFPRAADFGRRPSARQGDAPARPRRRNAPGAPAARGRATWPVRARPSRRAAC